MDKVIHLTPLVNSVQMIVLSRADSKASPIIISCCILFFTDHRSILSILMRHHSGRANISSYILNMKFHLNTNHNQACLLSTLRDIWHFQMDLHRIAAPRPYINRSCLFVLKHLGLRVYSRYPKKDDMPRGSFKDFCWPNTIPNNDMCFPCLWKKVGRIKNQEATCEGWVVLIQANNSELPNSFPLTQTPWIQGDSY